jgi:hypothetical protein
MVCTGTTGSTKSYQVQDGDLFGYNGILYVHMHNLTFTVAPEPPPKLKRYIGAHIAWCLDQYGGAPPDDMSFTPVLGDGGPDFS